MISPKEKLDFFPKGKKMDFFPLREKIVFPHSPKERNGNDVCSPISSPQVRKAVTENRGVR